MGAMEGQTGQHPVGQGLAGRGSASLLRIYMLGGFRLLRGEEDLHPERWELQRAAAVLKYLVGEEGRWVPTEVLLELFWPEAEPDRARGALRTTVHALRRALEPGLEPYQPSTYIEAARGRYRFRTEAPHWWDVRAFLDQLAAARRRRAEGRLGEALQELEAALGLYGGEFLPEDRYEEWTALPRERLRHAYLEAAVELGELAQRQPPARPSAVVARLREAVAAAPEREDLHRLLIWHLAASGLVAEALRQYEVLRRLLYQEFGVEPTAETEELVNGIRQGKMLRPMAPRADEPVAGAAVQQAAQASRLLPARSPEPAGPSSASSPPLWQRPGALMVDWPTFRRMVQLERRRMQRWRVPVTVLLLGRGAEAVDPGATWDEVEAFFERWVDATAVSQRTAAAAVGWQELAARRLRQGDVACPLGEHWLLVLLSHADEETARRVAARLADVASAAVAEDGRTPQLDRVQVRVVTLAAVA